MFIKATAEGKYDATAARGDCSLVNYFIFVRNDSE